MRWPEGWPGNYLNANRAALVAEEHGLTEDYVRAALRMAFADGVDLSAEAGFLEAAARVGLEAEVVRERIADQHIKDRLREYTDGAFAAGVHGVPTLRIGDRLYWGDDQLEIAAAAATAA